MGKYSYEQPLCSVSIPSNGNPEVCTILCVQECAEKKKKGRFTLCFTFPFRHRSVFVPSEWSLFTLSVVFRHLPEQHVIGSLPLIPSNMQPIATECIFRYLLIIRTYVIIERQ
jgi:hypothetical protein